MAKGTIKKWFEDKGYGYIQQDNGDEDVKFYSSLLNGVNVQVGQKVDYDIERGKKGLRARSLKILKENPEISATVDSVNRYKFLNPYNFVRIIQKGRESEQILGNCKPPPHDRYTGLTGRITCEVKVVTPLFISDSHAVKENNMHRTYRFFQYGGQPAIPASSLRGMIRSVFEALTNSCFSVFQKDDRWPLEHRDSHAPEMFPARVVSIDIHEGACLEILDCSVNSFCNNSIRPAFIKAGLVKEAYPPKVEKFKPSKSKLPLGVYDGMRVAALVTREPVNSKNRYQAFHITAIEPVLQNNPITLSMDETHVLVYGWLHLTGPNIENKHDERLFFRWNDTRADPPNLEEIPDEYKFHCDYSVVEEYNHHLSGYWGRLRAIVEELGDRRWPKGNTNMPQPSTFVESDRILRVGDLVYIQRDTEGRVRLRPVTIPRLPYKHCREDFLPKHLEQRCTSYNALCPACRVFGWVHENADELSIEQSSAYAGRVRFSHGKIDGTPKVLEKEISLAVLSTPKPTTTSFYLLDSEGKPSATVTYDTDNARLRGRKIYRHHGVANPDEYERVDKDKQNRTIFGALDSDSSSAFTFTVDFENMAPLEFGAFLYALELEDGMFHRLGLAKPLGFGSVKIKVTEVKTINWQVRLSSIGKDAGWEPFDKNQQSKLKQLFLEEMHKLYGTEFDDVLNDLRCLLGEPPCGLPIHYPRPSRILDQAKNPQYKWFVGNNKRRYDFRRPKEKRNLPDPLALALATDDKSGLTLIDDKGKDGVD